MAKLIDLDDKNIKRKELVKTIIWITFLVAIIITAFVYTKQEERLYEDATEATVGIHVKGAVLNSGFYSVPIGTRVKDVDKYVGGFLENADLDSINLAEYVYDGQEIYVPYKGSKLTGAVNLNTADSKELQSVSGIGANYANRIIEYRESHGGFKSVIELKSVLNESTYKSVCESFYVD
ncbi:MAG: helix-hairpin-helix domain-containing protein [Clostridia bacterium]